MASTTLIVLLVSCVWAAQAVPIKDVHDMPDYDINENEIPDKEHEEIEGLLPPFESAVDYYSKYAPVEVRNSSYAIDTANNAIRLVNPENNDNDSSKPSQLELDLLEDLAKSFRNLFGQLANDDDSNEKLLKPAFKIADDGFSIEVSGSDDKSYEANIRDDSNLKGTTNTTAELDTEEESSTSEEIPQSDSAEGRSESSELDFLQSIWDSLKTSISLVGRFFLSADSDGTNSTTTTTTTTVGPSTSIGLVALEEPASRHMFPSNEFEKGGRDIDSLFYGRGIA